ncbi:MAG: crosslink repair DNA glycosylase YcaQ family protein [Roseiflexus sp.]
MTTRLELTRLQILAFRRRVAALDERLPRGQDALWRAAWAGLQDSMPRAALLSIHARMAGAEPASWEDPSLVQVWGPRFNAYVVAERDRAVFTLGRLPDEAGPLKRAQDIAARLGAVLAGARMPFSEAAHIMGEQDANRLRYAAPTGTVVMRWDGARQPEIWNVPAPDMEPHEARLELARRYLHVFGPATPAAFATWADIRPAGGSAAFAALDRSLTPVRTPLGEAWILSEDESLFSVAARPGSCRAAIPGTYCTAPTANSWFPRSGNAGCCGRRGSGRAPCSSTMRSLASGGAQSMCSPSSPGVAFQAHSALRSRRRRARYHSLESTDPWRFAGMMIILRSSIMNREPRFFTLSLESLRVIGGWAADCAERAPALYETHAAADARSAKVSDTSLEDSA